MLFTRSVLIAVLFGATVLSGTQISSAQNQPDNSPAHQHAPAESGKPIICPKCKHENRPGAKFCSECGEVLKKGGCPRCGAEIVPGEKFCTQCGLDLSSVQTLKAKDGQPQATHTPGQPATGPKPKTEEEQTQPASGQAPPETETVYPTFKIGGFHDIVYNGTSSNSPRGFSLGQFVLHTNSLLARNVQFFSEISFTPRTDAATGTPPTAGYNPDIERAIIRFDQSDLLRLSAGKYHTPINWWNTAYHHGLWLQTTIARPEMIRFGGQFLPVHFVGGLLEGSVPVHQLGLNYKVGIGNGRSSVVSRSGDFGDSNSAVSWLLNLYVRPEKLYGLQIGGALYQDKIVLLNGRQFRELISSAHIVLETETPEFIAEYSHVNHKEIGGPSSNSDAFYVQVAYRLPNADKKLKPYFRYERIWVPTGEPVFTATPSVRGVLGGIRYDFTDFAAFKLEYRDFRRTVLPYTTGLFGQLSYVF